MKKLMFVAVAMTAGVCLSDIVSNNIVGFQEQAVKSFTMVTPTFVNVDGSDYKIADFVVKGATDDLTKMQLLDGAGQVIDSVSWYNDGGPGYPAGWYLKDGETLATYTLKPGEGVIVNSDEANVSIQSAGQVGGEINHAVVGFIIFGNGSPVEISVNSMTVAGATDDLTKMQILDNAGQVTDTVSWYNYGGPGYPAGWYLKDGETLATYKLAPGASVILTSDEANVTVTVPSALQ